MALVLVAVMMMAMAVTANAVSITINSQAPDSAQTDTTEYTWYRIFNADIETEPVVGTDGSTTTDGTASYYVTSSTRATAVAATNVFSVGPESNGRWYVELVSGKGIADIKTALATLVAAGNYEDTGSFEQDYDKDNNAEKTAVADNLTPGYYYITSTLGDEVVIQTLSDVTVNTKNSYPTVNKEIASDDANAQIGNDVTFTLTVVVPSSAADKIVLTDTMTAGLTFKEVTTVNNGTSDLTADSDYTVGSVSAVTSDYGTQQFTITFPKATIEANKGNTITITYVATVNNQAVVETADKNTVELAYGNDYTSVPVTVETNTQEFTFKKVDGSSVALAGAVFHLEYNGSTLPLVAITAGQEYRIATSDDTTTVTSITTTGNDVKIWGVDGDLTYQLVEDTPPTGYNLANPDTQDVTPGTDNDVVITVVNLKGSTLPSTGGIGTTIFYVVGALLVIGAGVLLVTKRRMGAEK